MDLTRFTDYGLLFLRFMAGITFADSGYRDLRDPKERSKGVGVSEPFQVVLGVSEVAGGAGLILGVREQLAALGLILIMLGAMQKKIFVWKTGFWGKENAGWYDELTLVSMLLVILFTRGGRFRLLR